VLLRDFVERDTDRLLNILNDSDVTKFLSSKIPEPYTQHDADWWIKEGSNLGYVKAIEVDGFLVGCIGINQGNFEYCRSGEIGYWLDKEYWRKGIMQQAVAVAVSDVFNSTDITRVFASVFSDNTGSISLLHKCGFELEGLHKAAIFKKQIFFDNHVFAIRKK
jgi:ribosomal-protein-alanine N-acetyltransferase